MDAIYLPVRPSGAKEGVLCAWGISEEGERVLLEVCLGMREAEDDWLELGRSLTRRGPQAPLMVVADGAPGLVNAIEQLWREADRQRCTVHRLRNVLAKVPGSSGTHVGRETGTLPQTSRIMASSDLRRRKPRVISTSEHGCACR
ncbi:MAG: hypothetical protein KatS3mg012_1171 [Gaiellaceae bacterium]|nr:MAG: hypothetical protein KatS3mg012_1171 [Gaiellaceae bacterium]